MTLTVRDVAARYSVSQHTVLQWLARGELRGLNVGRTMHGKKPRWRITEQALESFEMIRAVTPPPPKVRRRKRQPEVIEFYK